MADDPRGRVIEELDEDRSLLEGRALRLQMVWFGCIALAVIALVAPAIAVGIRDGMVEDSAPGADRAYAVLAGILLSGAAVVTGLVVAYHPWRRTARLLADPGRLTEAVPVDLVVEGRLSGTMRPTGEQPVMVVRAYPLRPVLVTSPIRDPLIVFHDAMAGRWWAHVLAPGEPGRVRVLLVRPYSDGPQRETAVVRRDHGTQPDGLERCWAEARVD